MSSPPRILMLVPHEPEADPRIKWVTQLCAQIGRTDIIGYTSSVDDKPAREYDGVIYTERVNPYYYYSFAERLGAGIRRIVRFAYRAVCFCITTLRNDFHALLGFEHADDQGCKKTKQGTAMPRIHGRIGSILLFLAVVNSFYRIAQTLYRRARSVSICPRVVICHDLYALIVGVRMKKLSGCFLVYDSHELWPEAFLESRKWEKSIIAFVEGWYIKDADAVITVSPQIARYLERLYGIDGVITVPNAEPFAGLEGPRITTRSSSTIKFLLQGRVVPGRGIEELMDAWSLLDDKRAVLVVRAPGNDYFSQLCSKYGNAVDGGRIVIAAPVTEENLVSAAREAEVGIIPYPGPNLCHIYACPNKLSQYMQAGLAILCNADMEHVSDLVGRFQCGLTYDSSNPKSLLDAVQSLIDHPEQLRRMRLNAYNSVRSEFNWDVQAAAYRKIIQQFYDVGAR